MSNIILDVDIAVDIAHSQHSSELILVIRPMAGRAYFPL